MNPEQLLRHFDRIAEAPDAVARLRQFVLDLAVRGKLVEQDPDDEPASELLKRIQAEKARLVKAGEIRKEEASALVEKSERPFFIPSAWRWVRLRTITSYIQRGKSPKYAAGEGLPVVSQKCVRWVGLDLTVARVITSESLEDYEDVRFLRDGDLLWNSTGTGTIGRIITVREPQPKLVCDSHVTVVRCLEVVPEYVRTWLRSDHVFGAIEQRAAGSTNQVELTSHMANNQVLPLPPLAEQHRIVAKVNELMALCDRLEAAQSKRERRRDRLVGASLNRLNKPAPFAEGEAATAFREHARFHLDHLPRLTTRPEHIKSLRRTIYNLAVRGKLVGQHPEDEPASALLKQLAAEKYRRMKAPEIRQEKPSDPLSETVSAFQLPPGWAWVRLGALVLDSDSGWSPRTENHAREGDAWGVLKVSAVSWDRFDPSANKQVLSGMEPRLQAQVHEGDFLISRANTANLIARAVLVEGQPRNLMMSDKIVRLRLMDRCDYRYIWLLNNHADFARDYYARNATGVSPSMKNVTRNVILDLPVPLPPLAEQHRIVAKVDELMAVCDQLEAQLTTTQTGSHRLLEAVLHKAFTIDDHQAPTL